MEEGGNKRTKKRERKETGEQVRKKREMDSEIREVPAVRRERVV